MASVEDILLMKIMQDNESAPSMETAASAGAALGALGGVSAGQSVHDIGRVINSLRKGKDGGAYKPRRFIAGPRMAGALVGAIAGGALGAGVKALAERESPAARMLAKIQTSGELTDEDLVILESLLAETYSNMA